jgi:hypothetical protein
LLLHGLGEKNNQLGNGIVSCASAAFGFVNFLHLVLEGTHGDGQDLPETILMGAFPYEARKRHRDTTTFQQLEASQWYSLLHFCQKSYWSRLWILRELLLPSQIVIQCEDHQLSWSKLAHVFSNRQLLCSDFGSKVRMETPFKIFEQRLLIGKMCLDGERSLLTLLLTYKGALCMDVRNKVYGLREIGGECCRCDLPVDYRQTPFEVCQALVGHHFPRHRFQSWSDPLLWKRSNLFNRLSKPWAAAITPIPVTVMQFFLLNFGLLGLDELVIPCAVSSEAKYFGKIG